MTARVILPSPDVPPYITRYVGVRRDRLKVVINGIDLGAFTASDHPKQLLSFPLDRPAVAMIARMSVPKDYETFVRACALLRDRFTDVTFLAIGDGPLRGGLETLVADLGLQTRFLFLGTRNDIPAVLKRLTAVVLSSRSESMGLTLLEGMAAGCAVIGSDIPAIRWLLQDGVSGLLFAPGDAEALAARIAALLESPCRREELVTRGLKRAQDFSRQRMAAEYLRVYEECI